jgi:thermostable 8-oxoguanine DNA glycosylase
MIDPSKITNYKMNDYELQEMAIFWVCVAGKTAMTIARCLDNLLEELDAKDKSPFDVIADIPTEKLAIKLKDNGIGCYTLKARAIKELATSNLNLRECSIDDLETIYGIGMKTSRCFVIHSRADAQCAGLDVHVLKFLKEKGHDVPKGTPGSKKKYIELEQIFLEYARKAGKTIAEFDLQIWNKYSRK